MMHTARVTTHFLKEEFPGGLISRFGDLHWPARSPDLTVPDFFSWSFLKSRVYVNKPQTLESLEENIRQECENLSPEVLARVMQKCLKTGLYGHQLWRRPLGRYHFLDLTEYILMD